MEFENWRPIETYDQMKRKPRLAVFWFSAVPATRPGGFGLDACANLSRTMGSRTCTHWMPLPEAPNVEVTGAERASPAKRPCGPQG